MRRGLAILVCIILTVSLPLSGFQIIEDLVNIRFRVDVRVFAVMAALNAAGFDRDAGDLSHNPTRKLVRERLALLDPDFLKRLRSFYRSHDVELDDVKQQSKYISYCLLLQGPPEFRLAVKPEQVSQEAQPIIGFERFLKELWTHEDIQRLWDEARPAYSQLTVTYRPLMQAMILETLRYMRSEARVALDRQVIFIPDLLNGYGIVNARNIGEEYILLVGPSRSQAKPMRAVRHEYLHFMIDPMMAKYSGHLPEGEPFLKIVRERPNARSRYKEDFFLMSTESLIHALELRLDKAPEELSRATMVDDYDEGLILTPYFWQELGQLETRGESLQEFARALIEGIRLDEERKRPATIAQVKNEIEDQRRRGREAAEIEARRRTEVEDLLGRANQLLLSKNLAQAKELLEQVSRIQPANANALFGMAQIAAQEQALDAALDLYERAAKNSGAEVWIAAWSFLRRGNIYDFQGDNVQARLEWSKVLSLPGNLRGAGEAAKKALAGVRP